VIAHALLFLLLMQVTLDTGEKPTADVEERTVVAPKEEEPDLTLTDVGDNPEVPTNYNVDRKDEQSIPGPVDPVADVGVPNSPDTSKASMPPPPGAGGGTGGAPMLDLAGLGSNIGDLGGLGGKNFMPGGLAGRSGGTRDMMLKEGGGNERSEAAVAKGLRWLALHQAEDGHWGLHDFNKYGRDKPLPNGNRLPNGSNVDPQCSRKNDIAGTAFGLLPFLGAGITQEPPKKATKEDYTKGVKLALAYLTGKQGKDGYYGGDMYAHCIATIAMCEAHGMTSAPDLKVSAQKAVDYILNAQHEAGGWRYGPKSPGDTSVTGWALMALKSAQMAGLKLPSENLKAVESYLNSCQKEKGQYGYMPGSGPTPTMTAAAMLCRLYLGTGPSNTALQQGADFLLQPGDAGNPAPYYPGKTKNMYYEYYATQVMHHMGGDYWDRWNLGPDKKGPGGIRDSLIAKQEFDVKDEKRRYYEGSWAKDGDFQNDGGRVMATSLSLLCLEVYYRHLPLYRRDMGVSKDK